MDNKPAAPMLMEHGLIPGHTLCPDQPGMENSSTIMPEDVKMNPNCPCPTRTCPLHGFCKYCVQHHAELSRALGVMGLGEHCHFHHCKQDALEALYGHEGAVERALKIGEEAAAAAARAREAETEEKP